ncbi:MAG: ComEA family DNA-binding protein [Eubacterium sp.]|nr:ComEA family DNA-binding protein [Eubacterium sp.]
MKNITITLIICAALLSGCTNDASAVFSIEEKSGSGTVTNSDNRQSEELYYVYVCGAVRNPGVYALPPGSRVCDAVDAAGGMDTGADETSLNQASLIKDGMQIRVYYMQDLVSGGGKVNINIADRDTLMTLPGIGQAKADAIIAFREENGAFKETEDLLQVDGIAEKLFSRISDLIEV